MIVKTKKGREENLPGLWRIYGVYEGLFFTAFTVTLGAGTVTVACA